MPETYVFPNTLTPSAEWTDIPQIETDTPAQGGAGGADNAQAQALANRLQYLVDVGIPDAVAAAGAGSGGSSDTLSILDQSTDESGNFPGAYIVYWDITEQGKRARLYIGFDPVQLVLPTGLSVGDELTLYVTSSGGLLYLSSTYAFESGVTQPFMTNSINEPPSRALFKFFWDGYQMIGTHLRVPD